MTSFGRPALWLATLTGHSCGHGPLPGPLIGESTLATRKKSINFEDSLAQLEELVSTLESGDLSLEDSLKAFEAGIRITRECNAALKEATQRVELLTRNQEGELEAAPFDAPDAD